jgi:hypothetical protein
MLNTFSASPSNNMKAEILEDSQDKREEEEGWLLWSSWPS